MVGRFVKGIWIEEKGQLYPYDNPIIIDESNKYDYIFSDSVWMGTHYLSKYEALIDIPIYEIKKLIEYETYLHSSIESENKNRFQHRGLFSLPIFIYASLSLVSDFFTGHTKNRPNPQNVVSFINAYFPKGFRKIQNIMWDGIRNGITHQIYPKIYTYNFRDIILNLSDYKKKYPSLIHHNNGNPVISINWIEYGLEFISAINSYKLELETNSSLQENFIKAYKTFEAKTPVNIMDKKVNEIKQIYFSLLDYEGKDNLPIVISEWD